MESDRIGGYGEERRREDEDNFFQDVVKMGKNEIEGMLFIMK